jgi:hypothetical protein
MIAFDYWAEVLNPKMGGRQQKRFIEGIKE